MDTDHPNKTDKRSNNSKVSITRVSLQKDKKRKIKVVLSAKEELYKCSKVQFPRRKGHIQSFKDQAEPN